MHKKKKLKTRPFLAKLTNDKPPQSLTHTTIPVADRYQLHSPAPAL
jgi:hypothetical protein